MTRSRRLMLRLAATAVLFFLCATASLDRPCDSIFRADAGSAVTASEADERGPRGCPKGCYCSQTSLCPPSPATLPPGRPSRLSPPATPHSRQGEDGRAYHPPRLQVG